MIRYSIGYEAGQINKVQLCSSEQFFTLRSCSIPGEFVLFLYNTFLERVTRVRGLYTYIDSHGSLCKLKAARWELKLIIYSKWIRSCIFSFRILRSIFGNK